MQSNDFVFTGIIIKEGKRYTSLCPELDVASEGDTVDEASTNLLEAVTLYLETAIEANLPYLRPIPSDEDPRIAAPKSIIKTFRLKVDFQVKVHA
ncbi:MAG: type II toxin-antitoxin system HicB family antitoxin [Nitrospirae bacterium]|nr:type II toxin-antitoxin system HicB family antitoxin [Nitrospirota bacterium]